MSDIIQAAFSFFLCGYTGWIPHRRPRLPPLGKILIPSQLLLLLLLWVVQAIPFSSFFLMTHFYFFSFSLGSSHSRQTLFEIVSPCALISFRRDSLSSFAYVRGLPLMSFAVCVFLLLSFRVRRAISEQIEHTRTHCKLAGADGGRREELADDESSSIEKALSDWMVIERNGRLFSTTCYYLLLHGCFCYYHPTRRHVSCECPILGSWILSSHCVYEAYQIPAAIHYTISARVWWESWTGPSLMVTL